MTLPITSPHITSLDLAPPKARRRILPAWMRSLIWVDAAPRYDAFLSYSWALDSKIAPVIQWVLQRFLCPWYRVRAKTIFRDLSSLPAGSNLEKELFDRLDRSTHLIVLASTAAAQAHQVAFSKNGSRLLVIGWQTARVYAANLSELLQLAVALSPHQHG